MVNSLNERYLNLQQEIAQLARNCGRNPEEVELIAVTKNHPWDEVMPLYEAGQRHFAENRWQAAAEKLTLAPEDCLWHFIGPLQKNKVRKVIASFSLIHSVDSLALAEKIHQCSQEISQVTPILLQVNVSREATKQGMSLQECLSLCDQLLALSSLSIQGLMTMAPFTEDQDLIRCCFATLRELRDKLQNRYGKNTFRHLSMGMSHDYPLAIAEGATLLRIGSALFP